MSWYGEEWRNRHPVCSRRANNNVDRFTLTIPTNWDQFWDNVSDTSTGFDIIVTEQDGETLVTDFDYVGFVHSTKTLTLRWNPAVVAGTNKHDVFWIYWNHSGTASDQTGTVINVTFTEEALISMQDPIAALYSLKAGAERPGSTTPSDAIAVTPGGDHFAWVRVGTGNLATRQRQSAGSDRLYEIKSFDFTVEQSGANVSKDTPANNRITEDINGDTWIGVFFDGLADANDYTGVLQFNIAHSVEPTLLKYKQFLIQANDPNEA